jgi:HTH-type transcriptional regulator / antitoxin HigA
MMDIRPIRNETDHEAAVREIERLWDARKDTREAEIADVLATLVDAYERDRWAVPVSDPVDILHYAISDMGRTQSELAEIVGSKPRASEILNRKRALTIEMIDRISRGWNIPRSVLAFPYAIKAPAKIAAPRRVKRSKKRAPAQQRKDAA